MQPTIQYAGHVLAYTEVFHEDAYSNSGACIDQMQARLDALKRDGIPAAFIHDGKSHYLYQKK